MGKVKSSAAAMKGFSQFLEENNLDKNDPTVQILRNHFQQWIKNKQVDDDQHEKDMRQLQWDESMQLNFDGFLYELLPVPQEEDLDTLPPQISDDMEDGEDQEEDGPKREEIPGSLDIYRIYCSDVRQRKVLTAAESKELSEKYLAGEEAKKALEEQGPNLPEDQVRELKHLCKAGERAKKTLEEGNLWLPIVISRQYYPKAKGISIMDLIQEGNEGLLTAAERFDPHKNVAFVCYATHWVKKNIRNYLMDNQIIKIPQGIYEDNGKILRVQAAILVETGHNPTVEQIMARTKLSKKRILEVLRICNQTEVMSAQTPISEKDNDAVTLESTFSDAKATKHFNRMEDTDMMNIIKNEMRRLLSPLEAKILLLRSGIEDNTPYSLEAIGIELGYEKERIRQIQDRAQNKLQDSNSPALKSLL